MMIHNLRKHIRESFTYRDCFCQSKFNCQSFVTKRFQEKDGLSDSEYKKNEAKSGRSFINEGGELI